MHTVKPLDNAAILAAARETEAIFTVEEHSIVGGLGGAVAELLAEQDQQVKFKRIGLDNAFASKVGDQDYLRREYGLDDAGILSLIEDSILAQVS